MNPIERAEAAMRRVQNRHFLIDALKSLIEGLPATIRESGVITIPSEVTADQFREIARVIARASAASTVLYNFAKGDLWNMACSCYGGGLDLMIYIYGEPNAARQALAWKALGHISRKVPQQDRDISRSWNYYRYDYGKGFPNSHDNRYNQETSSGDDQVLRQCEFTEVSPDLHSGKFTLDNHNVLVEAKRRSGKKSYLKISRDDFMAKTNSLFVDDTTREVI